MNKTQRFRILILLLLAFVSLRHLIGLELAGEPAPKSRFEEAAPHNE